MEILKVIENLDELYCIGGVDVSQIEDAEASLDLNFSDEYKVYVEHYGAISFAGHELTGICDSSRLNVVDVTKENREMNPNISTNMYVVEDLYYDGCVIWQDSSGVIYETQYESMPIEICKSLAEYIQR